MGRYLYPQRYLKEFSPAKAGLFSYPRSKPYAGAVPNLRCILLLQWRIMSNLDKDRHRRISEPTEADFARGMADSATKNKGLGSLLLGFAISKFMGSSIRRGK